MCYGTIKTRKNKTSGGISTAISATFLTASAAKATDDTTASTITATPTKNTGRGPIEVAVVTIGRDSTTSTTTTSPTTTTTTLMTNTVASPTKSVTFCRQVRCRPHLHFNDMTWDEKKKAWYQFHDYERMSTKAAASILISSSAALAVIEGEDDDGCVGGANTATGSSLPSPFSALLSCVFKDDDDYNDGSEEEQKDARDTFD